MSLILSIDIGTTKICTLAYDPETNAPVAVRTHANNSDIPGLAPECHEQDPLAIKRLVMGLLEDLLHDEAVRSKPISAIGITGQMHGVLLVDDKQQPVTQLITWRDGRSTGQISSWQAALGADAPTRSGCQLASGYGGATLAYLKQAGGLPSGTKALSIAGYIAAQLSGQVACDPTHAASWGIYDLKSGDWDQKTLDVLGIPPEVLPPILPCAHPLSGMSAEPRRLLGLDERVQVCSPLGDNQASVFALGDGRMDTLVLNLGTGGQISRPQADYSYTMGMETRPMPFGGSIQVGASLCGGWSYAYLRQFYQAVLREIGGVEMDDRSVYARMNQLVDDGDASGLHVDTRFSGSRLEPGRRGMMAGINTHNLTPAALTRAWVEGMIGELYDQAKAAGLDGIRTVVAAGNAVRMNPAMARMIALRFGLPCTVSEYLEEAALGAARAAAFLQ
jgi:sedoheptulokinase